MDDHERLTKILHSLKGADDNAIMAAMRGFLRAVKGDILDYKIVPAGSQDTQQAEIDRLRQELEEERAKVKDGGSSASFEDLEALATETIQIATDANAKSRAETDKRNAQAIEDTKIQIAELRERIRRRDEESRAQAQKLREDTERWVAEQTAKIREEQEELQKNKTKRRSVYFPPVIKPRKK